MTGVKQTALLHARLPRYRRLVAQAQEIISDALERMAHPYVAFSGGKDSTVVLHLVRAIAPDTVAAWGDDEWNLPETMALIEQTPNLVRRASRIQHAEWFTSWDSDNPQLPDGTVWVEGHMAFERERGHDGVFMGLRADENSRRRHYLRRFGTLHYATSNEIWQCNPLAWWSAMDVWAYLYANQVPYNTAYDKLQAMGLPLDRQRIGPLANARVLGYGQISILKRGWPDLYNRFAAAYPEATAYV